MNIQKPKSQRIKLGSFHCAWSICKDSNIPFDGYWTSAMP